MCIIKTLNWDLQQEVTKYIKSHFMMIKKYGITIKDIYLLLMWKRYSANYKNQKIKTLKGL